MSFLFIIRKRNARAFGEHASGDGSVHGENASRDALRKWRRHERSPVHTHAAAKTTAHAAAVDPAAAALVGDGSAAGRR